MTTDVEFERDRADAREVEEAAKGHPLYVVADANTDAPGIFVTVHTRDKVEAMKLVAMLRDYAYLIRRLKRPGEVSRR